MYNNINGIKTKIESLKTIIEEENPTIIGITETKLNEAEKLDIDGYEIKRVDRKSGGGGGVLLAYKKCLRNIMITVREEQTEEEMLWMKLDNGKTIWNSLHASRERYKSGEAAEYIQKDGGRNRKSKCKSRKTIPNGRHELQSRKHNKRKHNRSQQRRKNTYQGM